MNIYIVRHCQSEGQFPDANLTEVGHKQAEKLAEFMMGKGIDGIISSPYVRAFQSIYPFAMQSGMKVTIDERLIERILSSEKHENWRELLRMTFLDPELTYSGGESSSFATNRILSVIRDVQRSALSNVVLVTHGNLLSLLLKHYDPQYGFDAWVALSNPDVYHINFCHGQLPTVNRIWGE